MNLIYQPKITIATVVYNDFEGIENTILSVLEQNYRNVEFIVVDGMSTDGTTDIIRKYSDDISIFISEKDSGIYDAMNKAIFLSTGDWILFLNSSDKLIDASVLENIVIFLNERKNCDLLRGDILASTNGREKFIQKKSIKTRWRGMPHSHQAQLVSTKFAKLFPFKTEFKISADHEFFMCVSDMSVNIVDYPNVISICDCNKGISKNPNLFVLYRDAIKIQLIHFSIFRLLLLLSYLPFEIVYVLFKRLLKLAYKLNIRDYFFSKTKGDSA